jgi:hypothetical protein
VLVGLDGFHVVAVGEGHGRRGLFLRVVIESPARIEACRTCGVVASSHGRREVRLVDVPCLGRPVELVWRKRTWRCDENACVAGSFTEIDDGLAGSRVADHPGVLVGFQSDPSRTRLGRRGRSAAGHDVAHGVAGDHAAAGGDGR